KRKEDENANNIKIQDKKNRPVPIGKIYVRYNNPIVDNKPLYSITYTPEKNVQAKDRLKLAKKLSKYISMYTEKNKDKKIKGITKRNKQEYWYLNNKKAADSRLSDDEIDEMDNSEQYKTTLKRITKRSEEHTSELQ